MDKRTPVKEWNGVIKGWVIQKPNGDKLITDFAGTIKGRYWVSDDTTRDFGNRIVYRGDMLLAMLDR